MSRPQLRLVPHTVKTGPVQVSDETVEVPVDELTDRDEPQRRVDALPSEPAPGELVRSREPSRVSGLDAEEDAILVHRALAGSRSAFEGLYRRHAAFLFNLTVRLQGGASDAEDLVHDAFLRAHDRLEALQDPSRFRGWLGAIVVSLVRGRMRKRRLLRGLGLSPLSGVEPVEIDSVASPVAGPEVRAELAQLYALLRLLATDERIAWTLRYVHAHRLDDVAVLSGCSLATAKRRISKAQKFLDEHYVASEVIRSSSRPPHSHDPTEGAQS